MDIKTGNVISLNEYDKKKFFVTSDFKYIINLDEIVLIESHTNDIEKLYSNTNDIYDVVNSAQYSKKDTTNSDGKIDASSIFPGIKLSPIADNEADSQSTSHSFAHEGNKFINLTQDYWESYFCVHIKGCNGVLRLNYDDGLVLTYILKDNISSTKLPAADKTSYLITGSSTIINFAYSANPNNFTIEKIVNGTSGDKSQFMKIISKYE